MSETIQTSTPPVQDDPLIAKQDAWVTAFTGEEARRGGITIGGQRTAKPWQDATPSDPTAKQMPQPRDTKLAEIDGALKTLTVAANDIGAPLGRVAVDADIVIATQGRDALANAADRGEIAKQLAAAPALLQGIETARLAAVQDKADCLTLAEKTKTAGDALGELKQAASEIGGTLGATAVQGEIDELGNAHAALGKAATREALAKEIETAEALPGKIAEVGKAVETDKQSVLAFAGAQEKVRLAMEALEVAAKAIPAPLARIAIDEDIKLVTPKVETLNGAKTREAIATAVSAAPALVIEIGNAEKQAVQDKADCEALVTQQGDVKAAMEKLELAAKAIPAPLARTAIDEDIKPLTPKVEAVNTANTRVAIGKAVQDAPGLVGEIGAVETLAVKDKADGEALALKIQETAGALVKMNSAVGKITGKLAQESVAPAVKKVTDAQPELAKAADRAEIDKQVKAAPQLLLDIDAAEKAALKAEADWQLLVTKKAAVEKTLDATKSRLTWLPKGQTKTDLEKDRGVIVASVGKLATAATLKDYTDDLNAAELAATTLDGKVFNLSAPEMATKRLKKLEQWAGVFNKLIKPNAVSVAFDDLTLECKNAQGKPDPGKTFDAIDDKIFAAIRNATKAYAADQSRGLYLAEAQKNLPGMTDPTMKQGVTNQLKGADKQRKAAYGEASIKDMYNSLIGEKQFMQFLMGASVGETDLTAAAAKSLLAADTAIKKLPVGTPPEPDLTKQYQLLKTGLDDAAKITDLRDQIDELNDIQEAALDLVQTAQEAVFAAQAATEAGKKEIDKLIKSFGEGTDDPVKQATCRAAIAARFKVPLDIPEGLSVTTLPTIYEMLAMVGETDLAGLKGLAFDTDPLTTASYYGSNKIVLNNMRDPNKDEGYKDQGDPSKEVRVKTCKTTALHELGHHVDEIKDVMAKNMDKAGFAKWKSESLDDVMTAVYTSAFASLVGTGSGKTPTEQDLKALARSLLATGKAKTPANDTDTLGSLFAEWANIEGKTGWNICLAIRDPDGNAPWNHPVEISGGRAYHEGYDNDWYSYDIGERANGISDYQWRSPVEWFAEQFAFYRLQPQRQKPKAIAAFLQA